MTAFFIPDDTPCMWHLLEMTHTGTGQTIAGEGGPPCPRPPSAIVLDRTGYPMVFCKHHVALMDSLGAETVDLGEV